jgi:hypothetical protein
MNFAPFMFSTEDIKKSILFFSISSRAFAAPERSARTTKDATNMPFMLSSVNRARQPIGRRPVYY